MVNLDHMEHRLKNKYHSITFLYHNEKQRKRMTRNFVGKQYFKIYPLK